MFSFRDLSEQAKSEHTNKELQTLLKH